MRALNRSARSTICRLLFDAERHPPDSRLLLSTTSRSLQGHSGSNGTLRTNRESPVEGIGEDGRSQRDSNQDLPIHTTIRDKRVFERGGTRCSHDSAGTAEIGASSGCMHSSRTLRGRGILGRQKEIECGRPNSCVRRSKHATSLTPSETVFPAVSSGHVHIALNQPPRSQ